MIRVLSPAEWIASTPYTTKVVSPGIGINWTSMLNPDPNRWAILFGWSLGSGYLMPGAKPTATNIGFFLGGQGGTVTNWLFSLPEYGQMVTDSWWGAGISGGQNVTIATFQYLPQAGMAAPDQGEILQCQNPWAGAKMGLPLWEQLRNLWWGRLRIAVQSHFSPRAVDGTRSAARVRSCSTAGLQ